VDGDALRGGAPTDRVKYSDNYSYMDANVCGANWGEGGTGNKQVANNNERRHRATPTGNGGDAGARDGAFPSFFRQMFFKLFFDFSSFFLQK
jgi:hypothetical protein